MSDDYEKYQDEFLIFISHGQSPLWKDVDRYIEKELGFPTLILKDAASRGQTIIEKLETETEDCEFAVIIMTAEDEQIDNTFRARENVVHEIGFCQGRFGRSNVLVLKQDTIKEFSNISGIVYEPFSSDNIKATFSTIAKEIDDAYQDYLAYMDEHR